jgi:uncharacterized protein YjbJ (UPF0337 family)
MIRLPSSARLALVGQHPRTAYLSGQRTQVPLISYSAIKEKQMNPSTKNEIKGTLDEVKGKIKETAGKVTNDPGLEARGKAQQYAGKVEKKVGQAEKLFKK